MKSCDGVTFHLGYALPAAVHSAWRSFVTGLTRRHYTHDPAWAVAAAHSLVRLGSPVYTWALRDGEIVLVAAGSCRPCPLRHYSYYDFGDGPGFADLDVFELWLEWITSRASKDACYLRVAPHLLMQQGGVAAEAALRAQGWATEKGAESRATLLLDISPSPDALLASFDRNTRRCIKKCEREGVTVAAQDDPEGWDVLCELQADLALRIHCESVIPCQFQALHAGWNESGGASTLLVGRFDGRAVTAVSVLAHGDTAYMLKVASARSPGLPPVGYSSFWEAMLWAKEKGCLTMDLCGFKLDAKPEDPLYGVNRFKLGFVPSGVPVELCPMYQLEVRPNVLAAINAARHVRLLTSRSRRRISTVAH